MCPHLLFDEEFMISVLFQAGFLHLLINCIKLVLYLLDLVKIHLEHDTIIVNTNGREIPTSSEVFFSSGEDVRISKISTFSILNNSRNVAPFDVGRLLLCDASQQFLIGDLII
jgi:hypothetical protein